MACDIQMITGLRLVQEQLNVQHIEESTNPWNSPVIVIQKNQEKGEW